MVDNDFPAEVNRLIDAVIASVDHVEVLRVMADAPARLATVDLLVAQLKMDRRTVVQVVEDLVAANILREQDGGLEYAPVARDRDAIAALLGLYNTRPVTLIRAIYARPKPMKAFADAFRLRRDQ